MGQAQDLLDRYGPERTFEEARTAARRYVAALEQTRRISIGDAGPEGLPTVHLVRRTLAELWEDAVMAVLAVGRPVHTPYDPKDSGGKWCSFPSLEVTAVLHLLEPFGEPRFHKHYLGGWLGFGEYRAEIEGAKDGWMISPAEVAERLRTGRFEDICTDERWNYTYHQRLRAYPYFDWEGRLRTLDQIESVIRTLRENPASRSAQCITWDPRWDHNDEQMGPFRWAQYHPPCLQRFWFRLYPRQDATGYVMHVNGHWRSRDLLKAFPANVYGVTEGLHEPVRRALEEALGVPVQQGAYIDLTDSLHLYGHYYDPRQQGRDAVAYLDDVLRIASGELLERRAILPGTELYEVMMEELEREYQFRKAHPDAGRAL